jgi:hypothetical protein
MELSDWRSQGNDTGMLGRHGVLKTIVGPHFTQASLPPGGSRIMGRSFSLSLSVEPCQCSSG